MGGGDTGIWLVTGNDEAAIEAAAKVLVAKLAGADPEPGALELFREREDQKESELIQEVIAGLLSPPFLLDRKTVWLHKTGGFAAETGKKSSGRGAAKASAAPPAARIAELVEAGLPPGIQVVVSGPGAEPLLGAAFRKAGQVQVCQKPDPKDRNWQASMASFIRARAVDKKLTLTPAAVNCLVDVLGVDTLRLDGELEKLACYIGDSGRAVTPTEVLLLCPGDGGEVAAFALQEAIGERSLPRVWAELQAALEREKDPEGAVLMMLRGLYGQFRSLLQVRVFLQEHREIRSENDLKRCTESLSGEAKADVLQRGFEFITYHPFRVQKMYAMALKYSGKELVQAIPLLRDAYWKCISGGTANKQILLEDTVVRLIGGKG